LTGVIQGLKQQLNQFDMYVQLFPIYGIMVGINYWNNTMDAEYDDHHETEHLVQFMFLIVGISFHYWESRG